MIRLLWGLPVLLCCWAVPGWAQPGLAGNKQVNLLRSVQGQWSLACTASNQASHFQRVTLKVSFTHLSFSESHYSDDQCRHLKSTLSNSYRFILGEERILEDGVRAFAVEVIPVHEEAPAASIPRHNLLRYTGGRLYLGAANADAPQDAATQLNYRAIYTR